MYIIFLYPQPSQTLYNAVIIVSTFFLVRHGLLIFTTNRVRMNTFLPKQVVKNITGFGKASDMWVTTSVIIAM